MNKKIKQLADWKIESLPGLSAEMATALQGCGITMTGELWQRARNPQFKQTLAVQLKVKPQVISKWVAMADLARIQSIGCEYCGLLLHVGVASIPQLAQMTPARLHRQILRYQVKMMQRRDLCPTVDVVQQWIQQARRFRK
jgi:predicted flap endonuclease-1-like 5' DNA nuclease